MPPRPRPGLARLDGQAHVLVHREVGEQLRELEGAAQAAVCAPRRGQRVMSSPPSNTCPSLAGNWPEMRLK
jgi:hypothetical protein